VTPEEDQIQVIVDNTEFMIADYLDKRAKAMAKTGLRGLLFGARVMAADFRVAANEIRSGAWKK